MPLVQIELLALRFLLARLVTDLLQLAHLPLLAGFSDEPDAVDAHLLAVAVAVHDEDHDTRNVLEAYEP